MIVYYRLTNINSSNQSPIYSGDKLRLNELCLKSFVLTFKLENPKVVFIADYCGKEYEAMIEREVPFEYEILWTGLGINGTALKQYELAKKSDDNIILFQECDYIYRPSVGKQMVEAIEKFQLFSPYDHPDFYSRYDIHDKLNEIILYKNNHYRTAKRNTMTFGMTREAFEANYDILMKHGYLDEHVWYEMKDNGYPLHTPLPALATHMVKDYMAPVIPWDAVMKIFI